MVKKVRLKCLPYMNNNLPVEAKHKVIIVQDENGDTWFKGSDVIYKLKGLSYGPGMDHGIGIYKSKFKKRRSIFDIILTRRKMIYTIIINNDRRYRLRFEFNAVLEMQNIDTGEITKLNFICNTRSMKKIEKKLLFDLSI